MNSHDSESSVFCLKWITNSGMADVQCWVLHQALWLQAFWKEQKNIDKGAGRDTWRDEVYKSQTVWGRTSLLLYFKMQKSDVCKSEKNWCISGWLGWQRNQQRCVMCIFHKKKKSIGGNGEICHVRNGESFDGLPASNHTDVWGSEAIWPDGFVEEWKMKACGRLWMDEPGSRWRCIDAWWCEAWLLRWTDLMEEQMSGCTCEHTGK